MQLESNKLKYVSHGEMSPYVKKTFKNQVIDTVWFVASIDESLNEVTQTSEWSSTFDFGIKRTTELKIDTGTPHFQDTPPINIYWTLFMKACLIIQEEKTFSIKSSYICIKYIHYDSMFSCHRCVLE